jgi:hypothetical protein
MDWTRNADGALVVGRKDFDSARAYLRRHAGFDFDDFWKKATAESLLKEPLGSTQSCLSVQEIASMGTRIADGIPTERVATIKMHLNECAECQENLALYREIEAGSKEREKRESPFVLAPYAGVRHEAGALKLDLTLLRGASLSLPSSIVAESVRLDGVLSARGCILETIEMPGMNVHAFRATFRPSSDVLDLQSGSICDWVVLKGKMKSGQSFKARSLVCFKPQGEYR